MDKLNITYSHDIFASTNYISESARIFYDSVTVEAETEITEAMICWHLAPGTWHLAPGTFTGQATYVFMLFATRASFLGII